MEKGLTNNITSLAALKCIVHYYEFLVILNECFFLSYEYDLIVCFDSSNLINYRLKNACGGFFSLNLKMYLYRNHINEKFSLFVFVGFLFG